MIFTKRSAAYYFLVLLTIGFLENVKAEQNVYVDDESKTNTQETTDGNIRQKAQITSKVNGYLNIYMDKQVCVTDNSKVIFSITLTPAGQVNTIRLNKSSGMDACDNAVKSIIIMAQPFPINNSLQNNEINLEINPNEK